MAIILPSQVDRLSHFWSMLCRSLPEKFVTSNTVPDTVSEDYSDVVFSDQVTQNNNGTCRYTLSEIDALQKGTHVHFREREM